MSFLLPIAFIAFAALPVIVIFHLLKLRRDDWRVSSTLLWRQSMQNIQANTPFQKLRANLLLFLQLLLAAALALALTRPVVNMQVKEGVSRALLIDVSASMATKDEVGKSRLDRALALARDRINGMLPGDETCLILFDDDAELVQPLTDRRKRLLRALDGVEARALSTNPADALSMAESILRKRAAPEIVLFTDGAFRDVAALSGAASVQVVSVGSETRNVGITAVNAREEIGGGGRRQLFVLAHNFGDADAEVEMDIEHDGRLIDSRRVTVPAGADQSILYPDLAIEEGRLTVSLTTGDDFAMDDTAYCVLRPPRPFRVRLVTKGNPYLRRALEQDPTVAVEVTGAHDPGAEAAADLVICDGVAPAETSPGAWWLIDCLPPVEGFERVGTVLEPEVFDWNAEHPLMRYVNWNDARVIEATETRMPREVAPLVESRRFLLMALYAREGRRMLIQTFDFFDSNLPYRVAFPVLVANVIQWAKGAGDEADVARRGGSLLSIPAPPADAGRVVVVGPDGARWEIGSPGAAAVENLTFDKTWRPGFYRVEIGGRTLADYGVNLLDATESAIAPAKVVSVGGQSVVAAKPVARRANREIWHWLVIAALVLLLVEWHIFQRRVWV